MKIDTKRIYNSICAMICALAMVLGTLSPAMLVVQASNETGQKMLKLTDETRDSLTIKVTNPQYGKKYTFTCEYYYDVKGDVGNTELRTRVFGNNASTLRDGDRFTSGVGTSTVTITPDSTVATHSTLYIGFQVFANNAGNVAYIKNCTLTVEGSETNLITNSDFSTGDLAGWDYNMVTCASGVTSKGVASVVDYDGTLWGEVEAPQAYMLKLTDEARESLTIKVTNPQYGKKYTFTCEYYYDVKGDVGNTELRTRVFGNNASTLRDGDKFTSGVGTSTVTITPDSTVATHSTLYIGFQVFANNAGNVAYIKNCTLTVEGSETNLITNSDFSTGDLAGWDYNMVTCASGVTSKGVASVVDYDGTLWGEVEAPQAYMLKLTDEARESLTIKVTNPQYGKKYTFTCEYYYDVEGDVGNTELRTRVFGNNASTLRDGDKFTSGVGTSTVTITPDSTVATHSTLYIGFQVFANNAGNVAYIKNCTLTVEGSETNLITNSDFSTGDLAGWDYNMATCAAGVTSKGIASVVDYDGTLWKEDIPGGEAPGGDVEPDPKNYMLKVENNGKKYQSFVQGIQVEAGKTYVFSLEYYVMKDGVMQARIYDEAARLLKDQNLVGDEIGKITMEYTATANDDGKMRYFGVDSLGIEQQFGYMWNFKLIEQGSNENLFENPEFKYCSMKEWYPAFVKVTTDISQSGVFTIMEYDESKFTTPEEEITPDDKNYMLKIENQGKKYQSFVQGIKVEAGKTYVFSLEYYVMKDGVMQARIYDEGARLLKDQNLVGDEIGKITMEYTATANDDGKMRYFGVDSLGIEQQFGYMWNFKLIEQGSNENLFENPDFKHCSMKHWYPSFVKVTTDISQSGVFTIMEYDESKFTTPEEEITPDDKNYMLKIENQGKKYQSFVQGIKVEAGKTYVFSLEYYVMKDGVMQARIYDEGARLLKDQNLVGDEIGKITMEYTATAKDDGKMRYFGVDSLAITDQFGYIWNFKLVEKGTSENLFRNPDFKHCSMKHWYPSFVKVTTDISQSGVFTIMEYDETKLTTPKEVIAPDAKNYMLKVDNKGKKYQSFVQGIKVEAGKTYVFTLNYYVMEDGVMQARVYDEGARLLKDKNLPGGKVSSMTLEYTATAEEDGKMRYFGVDSLAIPDQFGYMWNFKLVQKGSSENLFENPDFKHLSMKNWWPSFVKVRTNISESGVFTVMEYDESKFVTPITYLKIPTGDPKYMAKLTAKYEADGKTYTHQLIGQKLKVEVGKTYIFSFNYYASPETTSLARIYSGKKLNDDGLLAQTVLQHRIEGTMEIEIVAPEEELFFMINPGSLGYCYVWNLCVKESGSDTNLFRNADFSEGNGSWYKWMIAGETVVTRDITEKRGHAICAFDRQLWIDLVDEVIPSMEPQDPNKMFSFDDLKKYYEKDHTVTASDEPTQLDGMSTASKVVIGVSAGLLGVLAIAVIILLKKKGMKEQ